MPSIQGIFFLYFYHNRPPLTCRRPSEGTSGPSPNLYSTSHPPRQNRRISVNKFEYKAQITCEPRKSSDANGDNANINLRLGKCPLRVVKQGKRSTHVEEFLVQREPEKCTLQEAQHQQRQGFVIKSITNLNDGVHTPILLTPTALKRQRGQPRESERPPPHTKCPV